MPGWYGWEPGWYGWGPGWYGWGPGVVRIAYPAAGLMHCFLIWAAMHHNM